jgi:ribonuclease BN (tRNA processing enzyme)
VPVGSCEIGPFTVTSALTNHPIECHALRIEAAGRSLTYSGDTGSCDALVELARDTDLFLCEASWEDAPDNPPGIHLSGREAGEHAAKAGARRLLLTHVVAWADGEAIRREASTAYDGDIDLATCGSRYDV